MDNIKKRKNLLIISILTGSIAAVGVIGFIIIWVKVFFSIESNSSSAHYIMDFIPLWCIAILCSIICKYTSNQYKKLNTGIQGEEKSQNVLSKLPSSYKILSNIPISFDNRRAEIDNLIISSKGIVIVESKNYGGSIKGNKDDKEWTQTKTSQKGNVYTNTIKNPVKQVGRQVYLLSQFLKANGIRCWIDGYVFMAGGQCVTDSDRVFTDERKLLQTILSSGKENALSEEDMERIKKVLGQ